MLVSDQPSLLTIGGDSASCFDKLQQAKNASEGRVEKVKTVPACTQRQQMIITCNLSVIFIHTLSLYCLFLRALPGCVSTAPRRSMCQHLHTFTQQCVSCLLTSGTARQEGRLPSTGVPDRSASVGRCQTQLHLLLQEMLIPQEPLRSAYLITH